MNRHAIRTALGRAGPATTTTTRSRSARCLPNGSTPTPISFFSSRAGGGGGGDDSHSDAVKKIVQLSDNNNNSPAPSEGSRSGSKAQDSESGPARRIQSSGPIDARALRVSPTAASASSAPKVLNLRSLRGRGTGLRNRLSPVARPGGLNARAAAAPGEAGGPGGVAFGRPGLGGARSGFGRAGGRFGGGSGRGDRPGGGRGRRGSRGRGGLGVARRSQQDLEGKGGQWSDKVVLTPEEQAVIDRLEKGEVVPFTPKLTRDSLSGYGAAVATDAALGQVETAIRTMRLMTGGMAFNPDSGVTADLTAIQRKYEAHMPFFVHSKEEKAWIESANPRLHVVGPDAATKKAIIDTTLLGKYEAPKFAEISDVKGTMAAYHARTFTYKASDSQKFMNKVLSLLPGHGGSAPGAQAQVKK